MLFSTPVPLPSADNPIDYDSNIVLLGSCFANHMAEKFMRLRFRAAVNPFGILFQPTALESFVESCLSEKVFTPVDCFEHNGLWHHFQAHSQMDGASATAVCKSLNDAAKSGGDNIRKATHIFITLGSAWAYRHRESGNLVANCHKVPQSAFTKELLSVQRIGESLANTIISINKVNPSAQVVFTVSPVRHLKDGFVENQRSKSHLIAAVHQVRERFPVTRYFPAYEIMMDELRDYRFYAPDMIHPNSVAIGYIWQRFSQTWIDPQALPTMAEVESILRRMEHRPFNPESKAHLKFTAALQADIAGLTARFAHMRF